MAVVIPTLEGTMKEDGNAKCVTLLKGTRTVGGGELRILAVDGMLSIHEKIGRDGGEDRAIIINRDVAVKAYQTIGDWLRERSR